MIDVEAADSFVLFVAPCPKATQVVEGWMGRIKAVDDIFAQTPRVYVDPYTRPAAGPAEPVAHGDDVIEYRLDPSDPAHNAFLERLILKSRFVYVHTAHLGRYVLPFYPTGKIVTDMHGIVPEEERMLGNPEAGTFYEGVERVILMTSRAIVVVTEAMRDHLLAKHPQSGVRFIVLPIAELAPVETFARRVRTPGERYRAIYAGGTQAWQNVDLMVDVAARTADVCDYEFLSHQQEVFRAKVAGTALEGRVEIGVCGKDELPDHYAKADFGFVLRDATAVNRVSCPTKLSEYLWFGLVPIVKSPAIGDFMADGYEYLTADEFAEGLIPDGASLERMRARNRAVIRAMIARFHAAAAELRALTLTNVLPGNTLAGLPIGDRHLNFPSQAELYLFGKSMRYQTRSVIDVYETMDWTTPTEEHASVLRLLPMVANLTAEPVEIEIETLDDPRGLGATCATPGFAKADGVYLPKGSPYYQIALTAEIRISRVSVRWRMGPLGAREANSAPGAPERRVALSIRNAALDAAATQDVAIVCEAA